ncbi:hypothetical protein [Novosphingobium aromaticivorans]|uniref:hypothetical protein n=1 Tax=Novosphingobium aromaticivorans TaxID=48935 RepID=UPI00005E073D|nr:hypothetical protein [Novosphingobium aromaticivorans]
MKRADAMRAAGLEVRLPPNPAPYLIDWLMEIGPTAPGAMSHVAVGWRDIAAWQEAMGVDLLPWEAALVRQLSADFANQLHDAEDQACPAPWSEQKAVEDNREAVSRKLEMTFKALIAAQNPKR